ncbi:MAG: 5-bromo-4-chloroindolyl phosphate hydrolysis family protein [Lachnospiraceae bacterium]|nr:5-bromo-4-chloroindolyl phosphate hydrolysis family protein [Lachnospiraceae bacterium]
MNVNDLLEVGNGILNDVTRAVETGNYSGLGERTKERVNFAASQIAPGVTRQGPSYSGRTAAQPHRAQQRTGSSGVNPYPYQYKQPANTSHFLAKRQKVSTGLAQIVGGVTGSIIGVAGALAFFGTAGIIGSTQVIAAGAAAGIGIFFSALMFVSLGILHSGIKLKNLVKKYYEYGAAVGNAEFFSLDKLAERVGTTTKELTKNLEKMIRNNMLPGARMDRKKTTLMLTDRAYAQYQQAEASRVEREAAQQLRGEPAVAADDGVNPDVRHIIEEGNRAIAHVRAINDAIPDTQVMSDKLYRLEEIMRRIFEQVRKDPSSAGDLRRFMDYYLPTTSKLLSAYVELDKQPVQGDNIKNTKQEIENSLDTINDAFEQLLDGMFTDMAMDIQSDISVMKTMMAQDGLSDDNPFGDLTPEPIVLKLE